MAAPQHNTTRALLPVDNNVFDDDLFGFLFVSRFLYTIGGCEDVLPARKGQPFQLDGSRPIGQDARALPSHHAHLVLIY